MPPRIAFVTYRQSPSITPDDALLFKPLADRGMKLLAAAWDDPTVRWTDFQAVILRSTWDYYLHWPEFMAWLTQLESQGVNLWNPPSLVRWNSQKKYLLELAQLGLPIVPSLLAEPDSPLDIAQAVEERGWQEVVVKPAVGAAGHQVMKLGVNQLDRIPKWRETVPLLIQPFLSEVVKEGEWSLIFFRQWNGDVAFSHAVLKRPAQGEMRVQARYGGTNHQMTPSATLIQKATRVVEAIQEEWLYARVDGVWSGGELLLMELEMIEPLLFLQYHPQAPERFAQAIATCLR